MEQLVKKYAQKLISAGLADNPLVCGLDDEVVWSRHDDDILILEQILEGMNINSLVCAEPAEPYLTIFQFLTSRYPETITPGDCETRTFLHDVPVTGDFTAASILTRLRKRKSVVVASDNTIRLITFGGVSPEQAFVSFSSVCFSGFVLFFADYLRDCRQVKTTGEQERAFAKVVALLEPPHRTPPTLQAGPFGSEEEVCKAIIEAGRFTVDYGLVDSYFGNISYRLDRTIYISQTGSSLDELAGCIDPCPMDGSSCAGITASSELVAHDEIYKNTKNCAILHGHPKFAVILSMDCPDFDCPNRGFCHVKCTRERSIEDIPIVPGEVGTGAAGLCNTLPPAIQNRRGAIVWGHGLFTVANHDFNQAFRHLLEIENMCRQEFFARIDRCRSLGEQPD
ncbi:MAG: class II aldolase/adducin family protein [Desulfocapsa sp.]|nr:class II aldolase/adducin family protein [Desulfocapsa sp.]